MTTVQILFFIVLTEIVAGVWVGLSLGSPLLGLGAAFAVGTLAGVLVLLIGLRPRCGAGFSSHPPHV